MIINVLEKAKHMITYSWLLIYFRLFQIKIRMIFMQNQ